MEMNKEKYEELLLRFAKELHDVGVTEDMVKNLKSQVERTPNIMCASSQDTTDKFTYRHNGFLIEATRIVNLTVKTCK